VTLYLNVCDTDGIRFQMETRTRRVYMLSDGCRRYGDGVCDELKPTDMVVAVDRLVVCVSAWCGLYGVGLGKSLHGRYRQLSRGRGGGRQKEGSEFVSVGVGSF
jgi:hypothetical protein